MSIDNLDDTSDSPIQFGLADKSLKVLQEHSRRLEAMVSSVKSTVGAGAGGQFSGKFLQVAQQQLMVQKDIAHGMRQLNVSMANMSQLMRMQKQMKAIQNVQAAKVMGDALMAKMIKGLDPGKRSMPGKIWDFMKGLPGMLMSGIKKGFSIVSKVWEKTGGALFKKTGQMGINKLLGLGGLSVVGALMGKMISSSPLLQAMFKILNTSLTLIMRPIGDFFGAFFRPMFMYFLKEVAIPFFQQGRGWMKEGEKWGRIAVGFFIDPVTAIGAAMLKSFSTISGWLMKALNPLYEGGGFGTRVNKETGEVESYGKLAEAEFFHKDPAAWLRWKEGLTLGPAPWSEAGQELEELGGISLATTTEIERLEDIKKELERQTDLLEGGVIPGQHSPIQYGQSSIGGTFAGDIPMTAGFQAAMGGNTVSQIIAMQQAMLERANLNQLALESGNPDIFDPNHPGNKVVPISDPNTYNPEDWDRDYQYGGRKHQEANPRDFPYDMSAQKGWQILQRAWDDFWHSPKLNTAMTLNFIGPVHAMEEEFVDILRSTEAMADLTQIAKDSTEYNTRNISDLTHTTALKNKQITAMYGLTVDDIGETSEELKEKLFHIGSVYQAVGLDAHKHREEILKVQDEAIELNKKYNLGLNEHYLKAANINGQYATEAMKAYDQVLSRIVQWEHLNEQNMAIQVLSVARQTDMISNLMTGESGTLVGDTVKMLTNSMMGVSSQTHPWTTGGANDPVAMSAPGNSELQGLLDFVGVQGFEHMISQGQYFTESGKLQQAFQYQGPQGQIVKSLSQIPSNWNVETQGYDKEEGWTRIPDMQTAIVNATIAAQKDVANMQTEISKVIRAGTHAFSTSVESQAYVKAGGGLEGLAKAAEAKAAYENSAAQVTSTSGSSGTQVLSIGGVDYTVPSNTTTVGSWTNPAAISINLSGANQGGIVSGGGSGGNNPTGHAGGPLGAAQAAGYSTGTATAQFGGIIDEPIVGIGMHSGREWHLGESGSELVTPLNQLGDGGSLGNIIIHIGNISKEADYMKLKPLIQRWILEASSRRGMV